jgi:histidinol-phosphate aminotransferase
MAERELCVEPNPVVARLAPYTGAPPDPLIELKLDSNESAAPLPPLQQKIATDWQPNRYMRTNTLEQRIADRLGVDASCVLVTAGADDALERAFRAVCRPGRTAVLTRPTFEILERYAVLAGSEPVHVPWWSGDFPVDEACQRAGTEAAVVAVVTPNNPTGAVASRAAVERLADRLPATLVLLDHAYVEYGEPEDDLTDCALDRPNVVAFRTFSKAWSAAGLRVGYAIGDPRVLRWMRTLGQPYPVSAPSVSLVLRLLSDAPSPPPERIERVRRERTRLNQLLGELSVEVLPSRANFVLARVGDAAFVRQALVSLGIGVRPFPGRPDLDQWLRITVPEDDASSDRLADALRTVIAPHAVLFDLDGVLADVSRSYREAIRLTAESYGVTVSAGDIARAKAAGNANNDWELTCRLLAARGSQPPADEVLERFEALYQGHDDHHGLWRRERLLIDRDWLERLAGRYPLGLVTGRPRRDADRFLSSHGVAEYFSALVTMEDAPLKPDPAPVRLALRRLGVDSGWMVGDTPDDVRAARAAGVLPIAVTAPGDSETPRESLTAAGAARVLPSVADLEELLP